MVEGTATPGQPEKGGWRRAARQSGQMAANGCAGMELADLGRADAALLGNAVAAWSVQRNPAVKLSFVHSTGPILGLDQPIGVSHRAIKTSGG